MSTASSSAFSLWAILSVLFLVFLVHHLWCYDRFKCLRWSAGRQPGAFKRVMTYSYLGAVPLLLVYSIGMTVIKYREGYMSLQDGAIIAVPINHYRDANRSWVLPLQFVFSFAWALEMVTHLEELAFWLYLLHQNPNKEAWFSSWEYRLWYMGSLIAIIGMPLTALITRKNLETCDAYIFLVGASGSTSTTVLFLYVLWCFPRFIKHVKAEGADPTVVVRLATFYQLNQVRVVFRFLFTIPLLILALDGIVGTSHTINRNLFITDFLQMVAGLGCFVSSMITLLIFFPRSIVREAGYKPKVSSTLPNSPKSPPVTPSSRSEPFAPHPPNMNMQHLPAHMAAYVPPGAIRMSAGGTAYVMSGYALPGATGYTAGATSWEGESAYTHSMYSPRESLFDSPQYTAEEVNEGGTVRRDSKASRRSRRASRRASAGAKTLDAHVERDTDSEYEGDAEPERARSADGSEEREDEERVPPYSRSHPHPQTHLQLPLSHVHHPSEAHVHQRQPFPHSQSSPQVLTAPQDLSPLSLPPPPAASATLSAPIPAESLSPPRSSSPFSKQKRRTWDWEERRASPLPNPSALEHRCSLHIIANGSGASPNAGLGLGLGLGMNLSGSTAIGARGGKPGSSLHPYVVNFTSPIDLVDIPPVHDDLPRAI